MFIWDDLNTLSLICLNKYSQGELSCQIAVLCPELWSTLWRKQEMDLDLSVQTESAQHHVTDLWACMYAMWWLVLSTYTRLWIHRVLKSRKKFYIIAPQKNHESNVHKKHFTSSINVLFVNVCFMPLDQAAVSGLEELLQDKLDLNCYSASMQASRSPNPLFRVLPPREC